MEKLTSDLFYYSRIGRGEATIEKVDLNEIVLDVKKLLADKENTTIEITETLPTIECEKVRIEELYRNLITNGIKYNESKNKKIEVGINKNKELYVKDNGIGIAPKFHTEVFKIFKRLHKREAYGGGTGSGLTFVKKIIDRHQGKIWIDSDIEKGTTFYFTLPGINR
jgi:chemotaxis family two-component system sensor kinase Cph1